MKHQVEIQSVQPHAHQHGILKSSQMNNLPSAQHNRTKQTSEMLNKILKNQRDTGQPYSQVQTVLQNSFPKETQVPQSKTAGKYHSQVQLSSQDLSKTSNQGNLTQYSLIGISNVPTSTSAANSKYIGEVERNYQVYQQQQQLPSDDAYEKEEEEEEEDEENQEAESSDKDESDQYRGDCQEQEEEQVESFKFEIERKFQRSLINQQYKFPIDSAFISVDSESSLLSLQDIHIYDLHHQNNHSSSYKSNKYMEQEQRFQEQSSILQDNMNPQDQVSLPLQQNFMPKEQGQVGFQTKSNGKNVMAGKLSSSSQLQQTNSQILKINQNSFTLKGNDASSSSRNGIKNTECTQPPKNTEWNQPPKSLKKNEQTKSSSDLRANNVSQIQSSLYTLQQCLSSTAINPNNNTATLSNGAISQQIQQQPFLQQQQQQEEQSPNKQLSLQSTLNQILHKQQKQTHKSEIQHKNSNPSSNSNSYYLTDRCKKDLPSKKQTSIQQKQDIQITSSGTYSQLQNANKMLEKQQVNSMKGGSNTNTSTKHAILSPSQDTTGNNYNLSFQNNKTTHLNTCGDLPEKKCILQQEGEENETGLSEEFIRSGKDQAQRSHLQQQQVSSQYHNQQQQQLQQQEIELQSRIMRMKITLDEKLRSSGSQSTEKSQQSKNLTLETIPKIVNPYIGGHLQQDVGEKPQYLNEKISNIREKTNNFSEKPYDLSEKTFQEGIHNRDNSQDCLLNTSNLNGKQAIITAGNSADVIAKMRKIVQASTAATNEKQPLSQRKETSKSFETKKGGSNIVPNSESQGTSSMSGYIQSYKQFKAIHQQSIKAQSPQNTIQVQPNGIERISLDKNVFQKQLNINTINSNNKTNERTYSNKQIERTSSQKSLERSSSQKQAAQKSLSKDRVSNLHVQMKPSNIGSPSMNKQLPISKIPRQSSSKAPLTPQSTSQARTNMLLSHSKNIHVLSQQVQAAITSLKHSSKNESPQINLSKNNLSNQSGLIQKENNIQDTNIQSQKVKQGNVLRENSNEDSLYQKENNSLERSGNQICNNGQVIVNQVISKQQSQTEQKKMNSYKSSGSLLKNQIISNQAHTSTTSRNSQKSNNNIRDVRIKLNPDSSSNDCRSENFQNHHPNNTTSNINNSGNSNSSCFLSKNVLVQPSVNGKIIMTEQQEQITNSLNDRSRNVTSSACDNGASLNYPESQVLPNFSSLETDSQSNKREPVSSPNVYPAPQQSNGSKQNTIYLKNMLSNPQQFDQGLATGQIGKATSYFSKQMATMTLSQIPPSSHQNLQKTPSKKQLNQSSNLKESHSPLTHKSKLLMNNSFQKLGQDLRIGSGQSTSSVSALNKVNLLHQIMQKTAKTSVMTKTKNYLQEQVQPVNCPSNSNMLLDEVNKSLSSYKKPVESINVSKSKEQLRVTSARPAHFEPSPLRSINKSHLNLFKTTNSQLNNSNVNIYNSQTTLNQSTHPISYPTQNYSSNISTNINHNNSILINTNVLSSTNGHLLSNPLCKSNKNLLINSSSKKNISNNSSLKKHSNTLVNMNSNNQTYTNNQSGNSIKNLNNISSINNLSAVNFNNSSTSRDSLMIIKKVDNYPNGLAKNVIHKQIASTSNEMMESNLLHSMGFNKNKSKDSSQIIHNSQFINRPNSLNPQEHSFNQIPVRISEKNKQISFLHHPQQYQPPSFSTPFGNF